MKLLLLILSFFFVGILQAQDQRDNAARQISDLKKGFLLVRLKQNALKIQALETHNKTEEATDERKKMEVENRETIAAFKKSYNFGKFCFFYSEHSNEVRQRKFQGVLFDTTLKTLDIPSSTPFLTAEFGESMQMGLEAFVIMDTNFVQLQHPFPFMEKTNAGGVVKRTKFDILQRMSEKLADFYSRSLEFKSRKKKNK